MKRHEDLRLLRLATAGGDALFTDMAGRAMRRLRSKMRARSV